MPQVLLNSELIRGVARTVRKACQTVTWMAVQVVVRVGGHGHGVRSSGIRPTDLLIRRAWIRLRNKSGRNRMIFSRRTMYREPMLCLAATMRTEVAQEAMAQTLAMRAMDVASEQTILVEVPTPVRV